MMLKKWVITGLAVVAVAVTGCASIIKGTSQNVSILSNVKGADVIVNGEYIGKTPYTGPMKRGSSTTVTLTKDGYETKTITLGADVEPVFWGNIIFGGVLGSTTDMASGAMYKYAPATLTIDLDKAEGKQ